MKSSCSTKTCSTQTLIMTVISMALGVAMLFFGLGKLGNLPNVLEFLGGAAHSLGLTFLPTKVWGWMAIIGEIAAGLLLILRSSHTKKIGAALTLIIMIVAAGGAHGWTVAGGATKAYVFGLAALAILIFGGGKGLLDFFGKKTCSSKSCSTRSSKKVEVIEA